MIYCTADDITKRFGMRELVELTDRDNMPPSTIDQTRVDAAIADAGALIDGYVGQMYRLPLRGCGGPPNDPTTYVVPPQLKRICCDLARYYLHDDLAPENEVYRRFKSAQVELQNIANGVTQVACPYGGEPGELLTSTVQSGEETSYAFSPRTITDDSLSGF